ncbi:MAG: hypothetical protein KA198_02775 [Chitinophagaceae bacterium]|nr:hypothetical protein [Chitinophagaceae bacterium]
MKQIFIFFGFCITILWINCSPKVAKTTASNKATSTEERTPAANPPSLSISPQADQHNAQADQLAVPATNTPMSDEEKMFMIVGKGKHLWASSCKKCHELYEPMSRTSEEWSPILESMSQKAKFNEEEKESVLAFFNKYAKK